MVAAVYLYQHAFTRHTLPADAMLGWTPAAGTVLTGAHQQTPQRAASYVYTFALTQQLAHMSVVDSSVPCARQMHHGSPSSLPMSRWALCDLDDRERLRLLLPSYMPPVCATLGVCSLPSAQMPALSSYASPTSC